MQLYTLLSAFLCTFIALTEASMPAVTGGSRVLREKRHGPAPTSGLARRHSAYTGHQLVKRGYSGRATWFNVGLGACGWYSNSGEAVVALAESIWNQKATGNTNTNGWCGQTITISYNGVQQQAKIVDLCPVSGGCTAADGAALDLSSSLFQSFTGLGTGQFQMEWWPSGGSSSNNDDSQAQAQAAAAAASSSSAAAAEAWQSQQAASSSSAAAAAVWASQQAASSSSSAAAAAAWASEQAASSSSAAAQWRSQQAASSRSAAAEERAQASEAAHQSWLSWNAAQSTSWEGVLSASRASERSEASVESAQSQRAAASEASAESIESVHEERASRASVRSERSESRASVSSQRSSRSAARASRASVSSASAADRSTAQASSTAKSKHSKSASEDEEEAATDYHPDTDEIPDSALQAINSVSLRLASLVSLFMDESRS